MKKKHTVQTFSWRKERYYYILSFCLGFFALLFSLLPNMIQNGGYFIYYGDFNSQQIPFYNLANDAVRSGSFGWNWYTDLGANFIESYSFYLLGSPFFWLSTIFPESWISYLMPYLLALKHGVATWTAYAYIRRFVQNPNAAVIGGLLYAFSGFQLYNIFFNHFQDVTAFFPLMLISMEELVNNDRRGWFAITVALMATINYFFFVGQVVFLVLYFLLRCPSEDFHGSVKKFFHVLFEAVLGVLMACAILLPTALGLMGSSRVNEYLTGIDMLAYSDQTRIWRILYGLFVLPDVPARPNLFSSDYAKWASIGAYLPMFSMAGVLAFMQQKDKHWAKRLLIVCAVCACVPILNSMFYAFNDNYYARWYYMPILIMAMMTAYALDNVEIEWKRGVQISAAFMILFLLISFLPTEEDGEIVWFSFATNPTYLYVELGVSAAGLIVAVIMLLLRKKGKSFMQQTLALTTLFCILCTCTIVYYGSLGDTAAENYIDRAIDAEDDITISVSEDNFFRVDISEDYDNYPMFWGLPNMRCFHSIVPNSIVDFYDSIGVTRDVASRADTSYYALRGLLSVQYYFSIEGSGDGEDLPGFEYLYTTNDFDVYENTAYVPMGFTYDYYVTEEQWEATSENERCNLLMRALVLTDEQVEEYGDCLTQLSDEDISMDEEDYLDECENRASTSCDTFTYDSYGFTATYTSEGEDLVFFSVPYESGWSATVNGEEVEIEQVDIGFMAVAVEDGENEIVFTYETPGLKVGIILSLTGLGLWIVYMLLSWKFGKTTAPRSQRVLTVDYAKSADVRGQKLVRIPEEVAINKEVNPQAYEKAPSPQILEEDAAKNADVSETVEEENQGGA